jgi:hypothetical protein
MVTHAAATFQVQMRTILDMMLGVFFLFLTLGIGMILLMISMRGMA